MQINIKVYFFESIGATFNWLGVLIEQCHGNIIFHMPIKDYHNCFVFFEKCRWKPGVQE